MPRAQGPELFEKFRLGKLQIFRPVFRVGKRFRQ
jgi:hypothetical protein